MENAAIRFPEVAGKAIAEVLILDDSLYGREVLLRFTDGTQLSICGGVSHTVDARYCREDAPDQPIFIRQDPNQVLPNRARS
jgi:hypothetical protein